MLADYKLYWDPKSNLLFFPSYETELVEGSEKDLTKLFKVQKYRPIKSLEKDGFPHFEAVKIASFGTWGLMGWCKTLILKKLMSTIDSTKDEDELFEKKAVNSMFRDFVKAHPSFRNARFPPENSDLLFKNSGVPLLAKIRKPSKRVKP